MQLVGRGFRVGSGYRYGFNGKENDNEVKGEGNQQDYGMRIYDPRLGRFLSVDPIDEEFPWNSPYSFAEGDPINFIDLDGLEKPTKTAQTTFPGQTPFISPQMSQMFKEELLKGKVVDKIFDILKPKLEGYLDQRVGVAFPETIKSTIEQHLIISGTDIKNLQLAIIIPNKEGDVDGLLTSTYDALDQLKIIDKQKAKIEDAIHSTGIHFIDLSSLTKDKSGKFVLNLFGKSLKLVSKTFKVVELVNTKKSLDEGDIPGVGFLIQSNPPQNSASKMEERTVAAIRTLNPRKEKKQINAVKPTYQDNTALPKPIPSQKLK